MSNSTFTTGSYKLVFPHETITIDLPVSAMDKFIPTTIITSFADTKSLTVQVKHTASFITYFTKTILAIMYGVDNPIMLSNLIPDVDINEMVGYYQFADMYWNIPCYCDAIKPLLSKAIKHLYGPYLVLYKSTLFGSHDMLKNSINSLLKKIGYDDLYYVRLDTEHNLNAKVNVFLDDLFMHFSSREPIRYLLEKHGAWKNQLTDEIINILEQTAYFDEEFIQLLR